MSKFKMSFSLIIALLLVSIMSTAVFARGAYWESLSADGSGGFNFKFANTDSVAKDFNVAVYQKDATSNTYSLKYTSANVTNVASNPSPTSANVTIHVANTDYAFTVGTIYKFVLHDVTNNKDIGVKFGMLTSTSNPKMATIADDPSKLLDVNGSGLNNVNNTVGGAAKTGATHGAYQNNTNTCASCHQTHTAANGSYLLFKDGTYSTCSACHDGTTGAYNSFAPVTKENTESIDGTFDIHTGQNASQNGSMHQADGSLKLSAAPGGNKASTADFDCASCHNAHGGGSTSENNLAVDPMGWGETPYGDGTATVHIYSGHAMSDVKTNVNGKLFVNIPIYDNAAPTTKATPYILVRKTATAADVAGYQYSKAGVQVGDRVLQTYRWSSTKYVADYSLWLREQSYPFKANTVLFSTTTQSWDDEGAPLNSLNTASNIKVIYKDAFAFGTGVDNVMSANVALGIDVETTNNIEDLWSGAVPDSGIEMSKYCAACHVDYLSETRTDMSGTYTQAHRHANVSRDELTCVRCHYAHGSEAQIMHDANDNSFYDLTGQGGAFQGNTQAALDYLKDPNPSSALKRYTGMSVCYACHGGGESFLGSPRNSAKPDTKTGEFLKAGQPGAERSVQTTTTQK